MDTTVKHSKAVFATHLQSSNLSVSASGCSSWWAGRAALPGALSTRFHFVLHLLPEPLPPLCGKPRKINWFIQADNAYQQALDIWILSIVDGTVLPTMGKSLWHEWKSHVERACGRSLIWGTSVLSSAAPGTYIPPGAEQGYWDPPSWAKHFHRMWGTWPGRALLQWSWPSQSTSVLLSWMLLHAGQADTLHDT